MKKVSCRGVLFDFDGTLIDSISILFDVYSKFLSKYGFEGTLKEFNELNGPSLKEIITILKIKYSIKINEDSDKCNKNQLIQMQWNSNVSII